jgi:rod shape-determining protein MreC
LIDYVGNGVVQNGGFILEDRTDVIRLSIPARQVLSKLTLPVLVAASFGLLLVGKADTLLAERARVALGDSLVPIYVVLSEPLAQVRAAVTGVSDLWDMRAENARLRDENVRLRQWQATALALDAEDRRLQAALHWVPDPAAAFVTARVVADAGGVYAKAVLLAVGPNHFIRRGQIALDQSGLVGRVTEVGARTARVLLITDLNSRVPVILEPSGGHAIMTGTNGPRPRLLYWSDGAPPREGERVVTSPEADAFPANLPVGTVRFSAANVPEVQSAAQLDRLEVVRIFDYGLNGMGPPDAPRPLAERPR